MAEDLVGGLTQSSAAAQGTPDPVTNPAAALQAYALAMSKKKDSYLEQQQKAYNDEMTQYANMVKSSYAPENNEAAMWGSMANAAADVAPTWGNIGKMWGKVGGAYGAFNESQQQSDIKNQGELTKVRQAELRALEAKDQAAAMTRALGGNRPNWIQFKDDAENLIIMDKSVGPSSQQIVPSASRKLYEQALVIGARIAQEHDEPDPAGFAIAYAKNAIANAPKPVTEATSKQPPTVEVGTTGPVKTPALAIPAAPGNATNLDGLAKSVADEKAAYASSKDPEEATKHQQNILALTKFISGLPANQQADVQRNFDRYTANPNAGTLGGVEAALTRTGAGVQPIQTQAQAAGMKETSVAAAKEHAKMGEEISGRSTNFQNMSRLLDNIDSDLKGLQPGSPIEPGKLANFNSGALSWMKAMGVPLSPEGERAVADAIALGKTNIQLSAADTKAISSRPAVFEFMQMLKSNPGPELTAETIKRLTDQMRQNIRFGAQENQDFVDWHKDNPLAPTADFSNYQNLVRTQTPWWNKFSENYNQTYGRYPTYADLAKDAKEQGMTFNQLVSKMHAAANRRSK